MMTKWLRRLSVRHRILASVIALALMMALSVPLLILNQNQLLAQQQETIQTLAHADRLLLQASVGLASSRVNLLRYLQGSVPTPDAALSDVNQALMRLDQARELVEPEEGIEIREMRLALADYQALIGRIQGAKLAGDEDEASRLEGEALSAGTQLEVEIEELVRASQDRLDAAAAQLRQEATTRVVGLGVLYAIVIFGVLVLAVLVTRSITGPVAALQEGAQRLGEGDLDIEIPTEGSDELSFLATVFNEMADRLAHSYEELEARVAERTRDLRQRTSQLRAVIGVSRATVEILDADTLIEQAVDMIRQRFDLYYVGLFLVDEQSNTIVLRAGTGEAGRRMLERGHWLEMGQGMVGWSAANGQARVSLEAEEDAVRYTNPDLPDTRSEAAIPLRTRGRVIGVLTVQDDEPGAFDDEAVDLLQVMADLLAATVENAQLYTEAQTALEAAERAYGHLTREGWLRVLQGRTRGYQMTARGQVESVTGPWQQELMAARDAGEAVEAAGGQTLTVPIAVRGETMGAVRLQKADGGEGWSPQEMTLVEDMLDQLAIALDSARLYEDTQLSAARERIAREVTDRMRATLDWEELLRTTVQEIGQAVQASRVFVQWQAPELADDEPSAPDDEHHRGNGDASDGTEDDFDVDDYLAGLTSEGA
jgi:nitrate/nitrite-specific signal transduction histidine kinase